ncbi:MAG: hypothetical protein P4L45_15735 [Ignavibacteriaceae bacterium]|nr:hypothetical protein [Ignavibacteriaceae bacterium]
MNSPDEIFENPKWIFALTLLKSFNIFWVIPLFIPAKDGINSSTNNEIEILRCILSLSTTKKVYF